MVFKDEDALLHGEEIGLTVTGLAPARHCASCSQESAPTARFCSGCGARLPESTDDQADAAERRHLTVLFADLVGSTRLAALADPEDWRNTVRGYQDVTAAISARYAGHIAQYLGDGILVYFGYPKAHEDDAERALLAGLGIVEAVETMGVGSSGEHLAVRVGVHTGPVVVGRMGSGENSETLAMGHTMNVAARLQGIAEPNTVVVSESTRRLASGQFVTQDLGTPTLKGIDDVIRAHRVLQPSGVRSRLNIASHLTPFVGRELEVGVLLEKWTWVHARKGQVALVSGEPGVGKSRLLLALRHRFAEKSHTWLECRCSPYTASRAFAPIRELIEQGLGFEKTDTDEEKHAKLARRVGLNGLPANEALPVLASFLEIEPGAVTHTLSPEALRERTMHFLVEWGLSMSADQPVLMLFEDLHWCDPSSLEFLDRLIARMPNDRMFVLMTARPEFRPPWLILPNFTSVVLSGLTGAHARTMVEHLCADRALPEGAYERIVARADGVPLHVEELTKMLQEANSGRLGAPLGDLAIPETLEGSLMARLDQLNEAKRVAQVASLLGREFDYKLLEVVSQMASAALDSALSQLVAAGLVFARQTGADVLYTFKHALIQDVSYQSLLKSQRREYHGRTARVLQNDFPSVLLHNPGLVAHHYREAEDWLLAAQHWLRAGLQAVRASANKEAITYLQSGLACVERLADPAQRAPLELELLLSLGPPLMATRGYADPDVERGYSRARELCRLLGEPPAVFPVMFGLWTYHCLRAKHAGARQLATDLTQMAQGTGDASLLLEADLAMGANLFYLGEFDESRHRLARSIAAYNAVRDESHRFLYGQDPRVGALGYEAFDLWLLGQTGPAIASSDRELEFARSLDHPFSLTYALTFAAWFHRMRGDIDRCLQLAQELHQLSSARDVALYRAVGILLSGSALVEQGQLREGLDLLERGMADYRQTGSSVILPYWEGLHADALRRCDRLDEAQAALERGFQAVESTGERWCEAELDRYRAVLLVARDAPQAVVGSAFEKAIQTARRQGAKAWELRATLGLARHCPGLARGPDAVARLGALRNGFDARSVEPELQELDSLIVGAR